MIGHSEAFELERLEEHLVPLEHRCRGWHLIDIEVVVPEQVATLEDEVLRFALRVLLSLVLEAMQVEVFIDQLHRQGLSQLPCRVYGYGLVLVVP